MAKNTRVYQKLESLDIEKGLGIFSHSPYSIVPGTRFLIVSYGGTGVEALEAVKANVDRYIDKDEAKDKIAFLAIDTCKSERLKASSKIENGVEVVTTTERFSPSEFFWLDNGPAKQALTSTAESAMQEWINPMMRENVTAEKKLMDGNGASGIRQLGRAMLYPTETINAFREKFTSTVRRLTDNTADNLKIFILSGISGGTGSGIVIDATYLIHKFISEMYGGIPSRTEIAGFLLLPPTGKSKDGNDVRKGNRNGIAALKEIDHFMTIKYRGEMYRAALGGKRIEIGENIFKTCYLLDGGTSKVSYDNARERANTVVADCILDMISSVPHDNTGVKGNTQLVDDFMSDAPTYALSMVKNKDEEKAPREANYVYCALGHGKTMIPLNLMKAYVAKRMFDHMYRTYQNCSNVTPDDVKNFAKGIKNLTGNLKSEIYKRLDVVFRDETKGPYYVINLTNSAIDYFEAERSSLQSKSLVLDKAKKLGRLDELIRVLRGLNNSTFDVYVTVMEEMKRYLDQEHKIICDSEMLKHYGGSTYTFYPVDFGDADAKSRVVQQYLDGLVSKKRVDTMVKELIKEMSEHRAEWTDLAERQQQGRMEAFNAAARIRQFWSQNLDKMVNSTVEDFLIKLYSENPNASYPDQGEPDPETDAALKKAASTIVDKMWGDAGIARPLADLRTHILDSSSFNGHNMLLIPKAAPHLRKYIETELQSRGYSDKLVVANSLVNDRLSCYAVYTGIPAFMFGWVERAEPDYEGYLSSDEAGLHMSETRVGEQWASFPNLLVESIWPQSTPNYSNLREHKIGQRAKAAFDAAKDLGLALAYTPTVTASENNDLYCYKMFAMDSRYLPEKRLVKDADIEKTGTKAHENAQRALESAVEEKANQLFEMTDWNEQDTVGKEDVYRLMREVLGIPFIEKDLRFPYTTLSPLITAGKPKPANWEEDLAAKLLRTVPNFMDDIRATIMVLDRLYVKIEKAQKADVLLREFSHYLAAGLLACSNEGDTWSYWDPEEEEEVLLANIVTIDDIQMKAQHYFVYQGYEEKAEDVIRALQPKYRELITCEDTGKFDNAKLAELKTASQKLAAEVNALRTAKDGVGAIAFQKLAKQMQYSEEEVENIKRFYKGFEAELQLGRMHILA